mgnify:CR=1 FL=1
MLQKLDLFGFVCRRMKGASGGARRPGRRRHDDGSNLIYLLSIRVLRLVGTSAVALSGYCYCFLSILFSIFHGDNVGTEHSWFLSAHYVATYGSGNEN